MVSLKDIAGELKVSISMVSKVLNGRMGTSSVSPRLRNRILKKAAALGYVPNRHAQALHSGRKWSIGIFITPWGEEGTEFLYAFMSGATAVLKKTSYHLWFDFFRDDTDFIEQMNVKDLKHRVDGLVVGGVPRPKMLPHLQALERAGIPVVTFFESYYERQPINIAVDNFLQGYLATMHILGRGCKRIAHFHVGESRYKGYVEALREVGLSIDPALVVQRPGYSVIDGHVAARQLLRSGVKFDAIVAQSDCQAFGACMELRDNGIAVPDQVRMIGVDDSPLCLASPVSLSSVTSECARVGAMTIEAVLRKIAGETVEPRLIRPQVVQRNSS